MQKKQELRNWAKKLRHNKDFTGCINRIIENIKETIVYNSSQNLMLFYPLADEINLLPLLKEPKNFCFPAIRNDEIIPLVYNGKFSQGRYKIQEPEDTQPQTLSDIDLIFVPALCVDLNGYRVGYGKGYYDRFIKKLDKTKTKLITAIYDEFVLDDIGAEKFDEKIDIIITEKRIIEIDKTIP